MLGGVPCGKVPYDNLRAAVARVLGLSRARVENERWAAFCSHYGIEGMYCRPGLEGVHEKGEVEGQIGWFRRNHLVPVPEVGSLAGLNAMVERWDAVDDDRRIRSRPRTIGEYFAVERPLLQPLPKEPFVLRKSQGRAWTNVLFMRCSCRRTTHSGNPQRPLERHLPLPRLPVRHRTRRDLRGPGPTEQPLGDHAAHRLGGALSRGTWSSWSERR
ncbi:hypothetical protein [Streptomyces canus]|uniref:hypothetical protein n=1 Tax=Streptomyces canus TaxID=58343 RepID=UPI0036EE8BCC